MRCKVTDFFSVDFLSKDAVVDVWLAQSDCSVLDRKAGNSTCNILGRFQVLLPAGATGLFGNDGAAAAAGSGYGHYRPGGLPTVEATLCAPGATSANLLFAEFAAHHALLGFDHVHLGVHHPPDSLKWAEFQAVLAPWLRSGRASLHSTWVPGLDFGDEGKQFFMHACLYHAKRHARWNAIWDFDEFLTPHNPNASLSSLIEKYTNNGEKELCWIQFSSFSVTKQNPEKKDSPWPTERYNFYDPANEVWKKSIANTKRIFSSGYHLPGACKHSSPKVVFERRIAQTRDDYQDFVGMVDPEDGGMHHYVNAFKNRYGPKKMQHEDEFGKYFFPKTLSKIIEMDPDIMDWRSRLHT
uniref:Glycosyltransferase family 92 protein n=1 Tax=Heterosigma akashiwo TaxID=2829 RepID=A0A6V1U107_HETAK